MQTQRASTDLEVFTLHLSYLAFKSSTIMTYTVHCKMKASGKIDLLHVCVCGGGLNDAVVHLFTAFAHNR